MKENVKYIFYLVYSEMLLEQWSRQMQAAFQRASMGKMS